MTDGDAGGTTFIDCLGVIDGTARGLRRGEGLLVTGGRVEAVVRKEDLAGKSGTWTSTGTTLSRASSTRIPT